MKKESENMEYTGERFVPEVHGNIELEHLHRYLQACEFAAGKIVLDIASGEGYGSAMLAKNADKVIGVDISIEAITHARNRYKRENLDFKVGSCVNIPLPNASVDLVVSFETIEHHDQHEKMMQEIKRVLRPTGALLISSPDKLHYSLETNYSNPYHIKELNENEFKQLLGDYFKNIAYFGQRIVYGSNIFSELLPTPALSYLHENEAIITAPGIIKPIYWIAFASDAQLPAFTSSVLEQPINDSEIVRTWSDIVAEHDQTIQTLNTQMEAFRRATTTQLHEIVHSRAWRIVLLFRRICAWIAPPNSRRTRWIKQLINIFFLPIEKIGRNLKFMRDWISIRSSGLFEQDWYLAANPDVAQAKANPLLHYLLIGGKEGRNPGPNFDGVWYLDTYGDVNTSGENPLVHFLRYGRAEGRDSKPKEITPAVRASLQNILKLLDIPSTANEIISALNKHGNYIKTRQIMEDIVEVEAFLSAAKNREVYPLIQASQLAEALPNNGKKNILFITSEFPDPLHGGGNRVLNFIESLSKDNDIYLCTAFHQPEHEIHLSNLERHCISILKIPHARFGGNQEEIRQWLHGLPMHIVHYEWLFSLKNYAADLGQLQIFTYMEAVCLRLLIDMKRLTPLSKEWLDKFEQLAFALQIELVDVAPLDARIAVTSKDGEFFQKLSPFQEFAVLNHGLDFEKFTLPEVEPEPQTLVFVGNYQHYPNADAMHFFFEKIWEDIRRAIPETRIYIVGTKPPAELVQKADEKNIIVTGAVADVRPYIQRASVCIAPLITGAGLRGKVIEYAALRRTFVATSIATTDLNFKDGIDYFCADQAQEFSQRIISLLKDPELAGQMADSVYNTARKNYDTKRLTGYLLSFYQYLENRSNAK